MPTGGCWPGRRMADCTLLSRRERRALGRVVRVNAQLLQALADDASDAFIANVVSGGAVCGMRFRRRRFLALRAEDDVGIDTKLLQTLTYGGPDFLASFLASFLATCLTSFLASCLTPFLTDFLANFL